MLVREDSSLSVQRKPGSGLRMGTGLSVIFHTEPVIVFYPELSYVELCTKANGLGCYWELIRVSGGISFD